MFGELIDVGLGEFQRQKVGVGEVAVVVGFFLGAHRPGFAFDWIKQARLLFDFAAVFDDADLAAGFGFDGLADEAD